MKFVTWNINSIRIRLHVIQKLILEEEPDIIALQETKVQDQDFPIKAIEDMGYKYCLYKGGKSYHGVAILSRIKPIDSFSLSLIKDDPRHYAMILDNGIEFHNFYIPAGGDDPDPKINPKFDHKLRYMDALESWFKSNRSPNSKMIVVGDLNVSPYEHDVWSSYQLRNDVSHTPIEREKHINIMNSIDFIDVGRKYIPYEQKLFTWWSYRNRDWKKSNRGRRLDHIWITPDLEKQLLSFHTVPHARDWEKTSDHIPVICEISSSII